MRIALSIAIIAAVLALALPAFAAPSSPIASKDGVTYTLEDMSLYFLRNLGNNGLIDFFQMMVVYQEGIKQGLKPTPAEISDFIDKQIGQDTYKQFKQLYSDTAVSQLIEYTIVGDKYSKWLRDKIRNEQHITVTDDEAKKYFFDNIKDFHLPQGVKISIISVDSKDAADAVVKRLQAGENFNDIAGEVNVDQRMRAAKGLYGVYRKGDGLPDVMEQAALALKKDQYSSIIKGDMNYHIIYCHELVPEVSPAFEDVKEGLMQDMVEAKIDPLYNQALDELMKREMPRFNIVADLFKPEETSSAPAAKPNAAAPKPPAGGGGSVGAPPHPKK